MGGHFGNVIALDPGRRRILACGSEASSGGALPTPEQRPELHCDDNWHIRQRNLGGNDHDHSQIGFKPALQQNTSRERAAESSDDSSEQPAFVLVSIDAFQCYASSAKRRNGFRPVR